MKNIKIKLTAIFVIMFVLIISAAVLSPFGAYVLAYLNSYNMSAGDTVTQTMWNNLDDDFGGISNKCRVVEGLTFDKNLTLSCDADEIIVSHSMKRRQGYEYHGCTVDKDYVGDYMQDERTVLYTINDTDCGIQARLICCEI